MKIRQRLEALGPDKPNDFNFLTLNGFIREIFHASTRGENKLIFSSLCIVENKTVVTDFIYLFYLII